MPQTSDVLAEKKVRRRGKGSYGPCAYCGQTSVLTKDHVIPQCLYKAQSSSPVIVLACAPCNSAKSKSDDDLRDFLAITFRSENHPNQSALLKKFVSSAKKGHSPSAKLAKWTMQQRSMAFGGAIRDMTTMGHDPTELMTSLEWIAKGIFAHITGRPCNGTEIVYTSYLGHFSTSFWGPLFESFGTRPNGGFQDPEKVFTSVFWRFQTSDEVGMVAIAMDFLQGSHFMAYVADNEMDRLVEASA